MGVEGSDESSQTFGIGCAHLAIMPANRDGAYDAMVLLKGPVPVLVLVVAAAVAGALHGGLTDLSVYQHGGRTVLDGLSSLGRDDPVTGLPFTYPPFAAVVMVPVAPLPAWLAAALWTGASMAALAGVVVVTRRSLGRPAPGWLVAVVAGGAVALEPVWQNLAFGQVNVFLMLAVLVDLVRPERRWSGVLVGVAAGVKLTPLVFVVLLVLIATAVIVTIVMFNTLYVVMR